MSVRSYDNPPIIMEKKNLKLYYSIKEVAQMFGVAESTLRFWEKTFPMLRPKTAGGNVRQYSDEDIRVVRSIHNLVKVRGFKIAAAAAMLRKNPATIDRSADILATLTSVRDELRAISKELDTLR